MIDARNPNVVRLAARRQAQLRQNRDDFRRRANPHNPFSDIVRDGAWENERCFIIGGGPSLCGFDFNALEGKGKIIAINRAFEHIPFADILFFMDNGFYQKVKNKTFGEEALEKWNNFKGHRVFLNLMGRAYDDVYSVKSLGRIGLSGSIKSGIYHGNNSGVGAVGLAVALKAKPIYLLGFDFKYGKDKKSHWHGGYPGRQHENVVRSFVRDFERMRRYLGRTSSVIINLNPDSGLRSFPFGNLEEVLKDGSRQGLGNNRDDLQERNNDCPSPANQEGGVLLGAFP